MADKTGIAWTDHTWNPWLGCFKVSQGCKHCYADTLTSGRMGLDVFGPDLTKRKRTGKQVWSNPRKWDREALEARTPARTFCASLADFFEDAPGPNAWRPDAWRVIRSTPWLDWQLLTKRPELLSRMLPDDWGDGYPNVWLGTSIESNEVQERSIKLVSVPAVVHFISYEPALAPIDQVSLFDIEWIIVGGESGPGYRPMDFDWVRDVRRRCEMLDIAFFFKQSAAIRTEMGIKLDGEIVRNYPAGWNREAITA